MYSYIMKQIFLNILRLSQSIVIAFKGSDKILNVGDGIVNRLIMETPLPTRNLKNVVSVKSFNNLLFSTPKWKMS